MLMLNSSDLLTEKMHVVNILIYCVEDATKITPRKFVETIFSTLSNLVLPFSVILVFIELMLIL